KPCVIESPPATYFVEDLAAGALNVAPAGKLTPRKSTLAEYGITISIVRLALEPKETSTASGPAAPAPRVKVATTLPLASTSPVPLYAASVTRFVYWRLT